MTARRTNIGDYAKLIAGIDTTDTGSATINGLGAGAVDRSGFYSCVLQASTGAAAGGTLTTFNAKLQDSPDGTTGWADIAGAAITEITADDTSEEVNVKLNGVKKFIRVVAVTVVSAGTIPVSATLALGGSDVEPI